MKLKKSLPMLALLFLTGGAMSAQNRLIIEVDKESNTISRHIYGHFSEHLGRCIYGGYWVGEDSPPQTPAAFATTWWRH